jgi:hypothetical protein
MAMHHDARYFDQRASDERAAAGKAEHPNARAAHLQLAQQYDELANELALMLLQTIRRGC